jgi:osmotically-inducible protein OsmY
MTQTLVNRAPNDLAAEQSGLFPARLAPQISSLEDLEQAKRIERALRATGYGRLRSVSVTVRAGVVCLAGTVHSYHLKQVAQAQALAVTGVQELINTLKVAPHADRAV